MDLSAADLDDLFEEDEASEIHQKFSITAQQPKFKLKDLDRDVFQFDDDSDTDRVKSSNCSVWSQDVDDWGDLETPQNSALTLGGNRNLEELSEMKEDDEMGLVIPDNDSPFDFNFPKSLKPAVSRDLLSETEFGFESENDLGTNLEGFQSQRNPPEMDSGTACKPSKKPMLITMEMMSGLLPKKAEKANAVTKTLPERLASLTARLSRPKNIVTSPSQVPVTSRPASRILQPKSRPSSALHISAPRPSTASSQLTTSSPRASRLPDRFSSGSQRDSKRPPTHRVAFGRTLKGSHNTDPETPLKPKPRKPTLIKSVAPQTPTVVGKMKYDPIAKRWLGNDEILLSFDPKPITRPTLIPHSSYTPAPHKMTFDPISCKWLGNDTDIFAHITPLSTPKPSEITVSCDKSDRDGFARSEVRHKLFMGGWFKGIYRDTSKIHLYEIRSVVK